MRKENFLGCNKWTVNEMFVDRDGKYILGSGNDMFTDIISIYIQEQGKI